MQNLNPAIIRLAHPLAFTAFLHDVGASTDGYFRRQGLPTLCKNPDRFVSLSKSWLLFADAAQREDQDVGWCAGQFVGDHYLHAVLLKKLELAPTLFQALKKLVVMVSNEASHLELGIIEHRHHIKFFTRYAGMREQSGYMVSQAYQLEVYADLVRHFAGGNWQPREIGIEASTIPAAMKEHFPASQLRINQPHGYFTIPRSCLHRKLCARHNDIGGISPPVATDELDYASTLRILLKPYLSQGYPNLRLAATVMDTSPRTLARRLASFGTTYQHLVDEARFEKARKLLENSDIPISEVGLSIGFNNQANFTRMFRRIGGLNPRQYRKDVNHLA